VIELFFHNFLQKSALTSSHKHEFVVFETAVLLFLFFYNEQTTPCRFDHFFLLLSIPSSVRTISFCDTGQMMHTLTIVLKTWGNYQPKHPLDRLDLSVSLPLYNLKDLVSPSLHENSRHKHPNKKYVSVRVVIGNIHSENGLKIIFLFLLCILAARQPWHYTTLFLSIDFRANSETGNCQ